MSEQLTPEKLAAIRQRHDRSRPGPYAWSISRDGHNVRLQAKDGWGTFVMTFARWGTRSAAPMFQDVQAGVMRRVDAFIAPNSNGGPIRHPDAEALEHSWQDREDLLNHIAATEAQHQEFVDAVKLLVKVLQEENEVLKDRLEGFRPLLRQHGIYFPLTRIPVDRKEGEPACEATR